MILFLIDQGFKDIPDLFIDQAALQGIYLIIKATKSVKTPPTQLYQR